MRKVRNLENGRFYKSRSTMEVGLRAAATGKLRGPRNYSPEYLERLSERMREISKRPRRRNHMGTLIIDKITPRRDKLSLLCNSSGVVLMPEEVDGSHEE